MQVENILEVISPLRIFQLPNFKTGHELALGFWWHIKPHVAYKKLMLQGYLPSRDNFHICDKFAHFSVEKDEVYLCGCISQLVHDEMAVKFLETCVLSQVRSLQVHSNQIKATFIIILPFNLVHLSFFPVSHRN